MSLERSLEMLQRTASPLEAAFTQVGSACQWCSHHPGPAVPTCATAVPELQYWDVRLSGRCVHAVGCPSPPLLPYVTHDPIHGLTAHW